MIFWFWTNLGILGVARSLVLRKIILFVHVCVFVPHQPPYFSCSPPHHALLQPPELALFRGKHVALGQGVRPARTGPQRSRAPGKEPRLWKLGNRRVLYPCGKSQDEHVVTACVPFLRAPDGSSVCECAVCECAYKHNVSFKGDLKSLPWTLPRKAGPWEPAWHRA